MGCQESPPGPPPTGQPGEPAPRPEDLERSSQSKGCAAPLETPARARNAGLERKIGGFSPGWGPYGGHRGVVDATPNGYGPQKNTHTQILLPFQRPGPPSPARCPARCPAHLAAGRGAPRAGLARGSGAALAHAPGPRAVQHPRPQLAPAGARPCSAFYPWLRLRPVRPARSATFGFSFSRRAEAGPRSSG